MLFGTRPEIIKLSPVIRALQSQPRTFRTVTVNAGQHTDLLEPLVQQLGVRVDYGLQVMQAGQTPNQVCARLLTELEPVLRETKPAAILVQGDTSTALAGALAGFNLRIPVGHVEAGLRTDDPQNPFPEEMNRRLITRLATWHFAATERNRQTLLDEGVAAESITVTGNPVVDALHEIRGRTLSPKLRLVLAATEGQKRLVVTTHRRESFGDKMAVNLRVLRDFVGRHADVTLLFPVHPNPSVRSVAHAVLGEQPRVHLLEPLDYQDFIGLLDNAWLIASDSGGIQEEAPTLGVPLLVLRENTERPEAIEVGAAQLVGNSAGRLRTLLEATYAGDAWAEQVRGIANPFGQGDSGQRIAGALAQALGVTLRNEVHA